MNSTSARTWWAVGDPQAPFETFRRILQHHGLLRADGRLRDEVGLVSMGDHFDYGTGPDVAEIGRNGEQILRWFASHAREQVVILLGNHDTCRVQEFAFESDASFREARAAAARVQALAPDPGEAASNEYQRALARFRAEFPRIPTPGLVTRDFSSFNVEQRALVQTLLVERRFALAAVGTVEGDPVLLNHAGVTELQLEHLGLSKTARPEEVAAALNRFLWQRVERAQEAWCRGEAAALDLSPLHVAGAAGQEGHGLLYHRPANPDRPGEVDRGWEFGAGRARRYSPKSLPLGLVQVCGHSGHKRLRTELQPWVSADALQVERGGLRTLTRLPDGRVNYQMGIHPPPEGGAAVYLVDADMNRIAPETYPLLRLGAVEVPGELAP